MKRKSLPPIQNFCDRWCERCIVASHCPVYTAKSNEAFLQKRKDLENRAFWGYISYLLYTSHDCLVKMSEENMGTISEEKENSLEINDFSMTDLSLLAGEYAGKVWEWLKANKDKIHEREELMKETNPVVLKLFTDVIEVIRWYGQLISVKVEKSILNIKRERKPDELDIYAPARIALLAADRSMGAFCALLQWWEEDDELLNFLDMLTELSNAILGLFPNVLMVPEPAQWN